MSFFRAEIYRSLLTPPPSTVCLFDRPPLIRIHHWTDLSYHFVHCCSVNGWRVGGRSENLLLSLGISPPPRAFRVDRSIIQFGCKFLFNWANVNWPSPDSTILFLIHFFLYTILLSVACRMYVGRRGLSQSAVLLRYFLYCCVLFKAHHIYCTVLGIYVYKTKTPERSVRNIQRASSSSLSSVTSITLLID